MEKVEEQIRKQIEQAYKDAWTTLLHDRVKQTPS